MYSAIVLFAYTIFKDILEVLNQQTTPYISYYFLFTFI